tara:strand:- start:876 stop:1277 length:402 start_codon:yes stop_codon:yes gene_type:complete
VPPSRYRNKRQNINGLAKDRPFFYALISPKITFSHESEHVLEHDLSTKSNFSAPKIYTAKGDLSKRWYVYFSFRDPITKKLVRMKNIYGKANNYKTKADTLTILTSYRKNLLKLLKEGYSPFEKNEKLKNPID